MTEKFEMFDKPIESFQRSILTILPLIAFFRQSVASYPDIDTIDTILNKAVDGISKLDRSVLLFNLKFLQTTDVRNDRKRAVYLYIKGKKKLDEIPISELESLGTFLQAVPAHHLQDELSCKKFDVLTVLGRANLDRKLLGVIAHCLKRDLGKQVFTNYEYINKFISAICGFGVEDLERIDEDNFILIDEEVFVNLDECNSHQLKVLYAIAVKPTVYGIPQGWNKYVVKTIGTLLANTPIPDLIEMDPRAFEGLKPKVLRKLDLKMIEILKASVAHFDLYTKNEFWKIVGVASDAYSWKEMKNIDVILFSVVSKVISRIFQ